MLSIYLKSPAVPDAIKKFMANEEGGKIGLREQAKKSVGEHSRRIIKDMKEGYIKEMGDFCSLF